MKQLFTILGFLLATAAMAQQKTGKNQTPPIPPPPAPVKIETADKRAPAVVLGEQHFGYTEEIPQEDGMVFVRERLLEYGWAGDLARMVIKEYRYDPVEKKRFEDQGHTYLAVTQEVQYIEGKFRLRDDTLIFTPDKLDKFDAVTFDVRYNKESKQVESLLDTAGNEWPPVDPPDPLVAQ